jgi:hypothetical protein
VVPIVLVTGWVSTQLGPFILYPAILVILIIPAHELNIVTIFIIIHGQPGCLHMCLNLFVTLDCLTLQMKALQLLEISVTSCPVTMYHIPEGFFLHLIVV